MVNYDSYGGAWTMRKLEALRAYLSAYLDALKNQRFKLIYIDAFAGPGIWKRQDPMDDSPLFNIPEADKYKSGSPLIALEATSSGEHVRTFDEFYFIDNNKEYIDELQRLTSEKHSDKLCKAKFIVGDANDEVTELCHTVDWKPHRAVMFLDPFGMEVEWQTIEAIAATEAIDLWVLFPLGIGVNRMLTKDGKISDPWHKKLDSLFGTRDWFQHFYETKQQPKMLFPSGPDEYLEKNASFTRIAEYFLERMETIFAGVVKKPLMLKNSRGNPMFALCFAAGNKRGAPIAKRIANHIIGKA